MIVEYNESITTPLCLLWRNFVSNQLQKSHYIVLVGRFGSHKHRIRNARANSSEQCLIWRTFCGHRYLCRSIRVLPAFQGISCYVEGRLVEINYSAVLCLQRAQSMCKCSALNAQCVLVENCSVEHFLGPPIFHSVSLVKCLQSCHAD